MAFIYKITNDINDKVYIGKTEFTIEKRFKEHCLEVQKQQEEKRPLYSAMKKYGIKHFHVSLIEETDEPEEREIYWIKKYNSYLKGYNATLGGDGRVQYDHEQIIKALKENPYPVEIAKQMGCSKDLVYLIARSNQIPVKNKSQENLRNNLKRKIFAYNKDESLVQSFDSVSDAAKWCFSLGKCASLNSGVRSHIADCANGKRKSAYGYKWKYEV